LAPQHLAVPFISNAHEKSVPATIEVTLVKPLTVAGIVLDVVPPLPSWPAAFEPQHATVPFDRRAHE
jgi:hypothetical protein